MCIRVNTDRVRMGHEQPTLAHQHLPLLAKHSDVPRFSGYVQSSQAGIKGENVRVFPNRMCRQYLHGGQVHDGELVVFFSRHESQSLSHVKGDTMRAVYSGHRIAPDDFGCWRIKRDEFVLFVNRNQDAPRAGVVDRITSPAAQWNNRYEGIGFWVYYRICIAVFVRYEDPLSVKGVSDAIRVVDRTYF